MIKCECQILQLYTESIYSYATVRCGCQQGLYETLTPWLFPTLLSFRPSFDLAGIWDCARSFCGSGLEQNTHIFFATTQSHGQNCLQAKYSPIMYLGIEGKLKPEKLPRKNWVLLQRLTSYISIFHLIRISFTWSQWVSIEPYSPVLEIFRSGSFPFSFAIESC